MKKSNIQVTTNYLSKVIELVMTSGYRSPLSYTSRVWVKKHETGSLLGIRLVSGNRS